MGSQSHTIPINWKAELQSWRDSGLPLTRFCREQGLEEVGVRPEWHLLKR